MDAADSWYQHHHLAPGFVDGDAAEERSVEEPHPDPGPEQVVIERNLVEVECVVGGAPVKCPVGQGRTSAIVLVGEPTRSVRQFDILDRRALQRAQEEKKSLVKT